MFWYKGRIGGTCLASLLFNIIMEKHFWWVFIRKKKKSTQFHVGVAYGYWVVNRPGLLLCPGKWCCHVGCLWSPSTSWCHGCPRPGGWGWDSLGQGTWPPHLPNDTRSQWGMIFLIPLDLWRQCLGSRSESRKRDKPEMKVNYACILKRRTKQV